MNNNCTCEFSCTGLATAASIIIGIITAILRFTAVTTLTPAFLWVVFGIAVIFLGITLIISAVTDTDRRCVCRTIRVLLIGILGTVLLSLILLAVTFAATSIIGALFSGALLAFFSLVLTSVACLIKCVAGCRE